MWLEQHLIDIFRLDDGRDEGQTVVATARGVFDHNGGVLESKETGVSIVIPEGALPEGVQQNLLQSL